MYVSQCIKRKSHLLTRHHSRLGRPTESRQHWFPVLRNRVAFPKQDNVRINDVEAQMNDNRSPNHSSVCSGEVQLQHECTDAELEGCHCSEVEVLSKPEVLQKHSNIGFGNSWVPDMLSSTIPCCQVPKGCSDYGTDLTLSDHTLTSHL